MMPLHHHPHDRDWIAQQFGYIPEAYHAAIQAHYSHLYRTAGAHDGAKRRNANQYLAAMAEHAKTRRYPLDEDTLKRKAERMALLCRKTAKMAGDNALTALFEIFHGQGFAPESLFVYGTQGAIARLSDADFWKRKLITRQDREQEAYAIAAGLVHRKSGVYISDESFKTRMQRIANSLKALAVLEAVNEDTGETVDMLQVLKGSVANPEIRRMELMVRMRGFEEAAKLAGHVGMFYTLTCPSKYHRMTTIDGKPTENPNWNGATPRQAQDYLANLWARIRAKLHRDDLTAYGFRVAEPHHDATPHWHMLLFMPPQDRDNVTAILRAYAFMEDPDEAGASKHRFEAVTIDSNKGSATGYIAKYVAKNIDGYGVDEDFETGIDAADTAQRVRAWASLWGIRQFQQIGGAPVGVWRELRRLRTAPPDSLELLQQAWQAADSGDWCRYLQLQGGTTTPRKAQPLRVYTVERLNTATGELISNKYGEWLSAVKGVSLLDLHKVETRVYSWRIQQKADAPKPESLVTLPVEGSAGFELIPSSFSLGSACAAPWSTVNNCTRDTPDHLEAHYEAWLERLAIMQEGENLTSNSPPNGQGAAG